MEQNAPNSLSSWTSRQQHNLKEYIRQRLNAGSNEMHSETPDNPLRNPSLDFDHEFSRQH
ncbi:hypothetical protein EYF80_011796 [Liparis tanakae]|uniref:Uncharacterized protein n=1 Tax=Liparis tanakae TaxID=230148 RepID=A0A4Z2ILG3_9TELE|nr:hypothetical protein EYF80_011796 [Liparis tanakae]